MKKILMVSLGVFSLSLATFSVNAQNDAKYADKKKPIVAKEDNTLKGAPQNDLQKPQMPNVAPVGQVAQDKPEAMESKTQVTPEANKPTPLGQNTQKTVEPKNIDKPKISTVPNASKEVLTPQPATKTTLREQ